jgi:hypothetical protein
MMNKFILTFLYAGTLMLAACGGGDSETSLQATTVSAGQELIDLQKAYQSGVITEPEYNAAKEKILDKR